MKNIVLIKLLASFAGEICRVLLDCEEIDVDVDVKLSDSESNIAIKAKALDDSTVNRSEISEDEIDRECEKHIDCCGCPYKNYCDEEDN